MRPFNLSGQPSVARRRVRFWLRWSPLLILAGLALWAFAIEPGWLAERQLVMSSARWNAPEIRIAVASDLHVGAPHAGLDKLDVLVDRINAAKPDLIVLPGDFVIRGIVGGDAIDPEAIADRLARLSAPLGVFATLGNHDWWFDQGKGDRVRQALIRQGIRVLENEAVTLTHRGQRFSLIGIGDDMTNHVDLGRAMSGVDPALPAIVMVHDPATLSELPAGPAIAFAGHTHGGQVALPFFGALITPGRAPRAHAYGWVNAGPVPAFVTAGVGTSILPVRFNRRPEYLILRLLPAAMPVQPVPPV